MDGIRLKQSLQDYWSNNVWYKNKISSIRYRNTFKLILSLFHFCDYENKDKNDKLYKVVQLVKLMYKKFQEAFCPRENVCNDKSMVPFRSRLDFRQFVLEKDTGMEFNCINCALQEVMQG